MSELFSRIQKLIESGEARVSEHGFDELSDDGLSAREAVAGAVTAKVIEEYPQYPKGPCVLVLERDREDRPFHVVWGIPKGYNTPAVLITAYRPDPARWDESFTRRME